MFQAKSGHPVRFHYHFMPMLHSVLTLTGDFAWRQTGFTASASLFSAALALKGSLEFFFKTPLVTGGRNLLGKECLKYNHQDPSSLWFFWFCLFSLCMLVLASNWKRLQQFQSSHTGTLLVVKNCHFQPEVMVFKTIKNHYNRALTSEKKTPVLLDQI